MAKLLVFAVSVALALSGCGIPRDPDGTLDRARQRGQLVVGASHSEPVLVVDGDEVSGPEAELVTEFADAHGMSVRWVPGGEEKLVGMMEHGQIDLIVGGLTAQSPWSKKVGLTRPWTEGVDDCGEPIERVIAVPLGENALLSELERFFDERRER